MGCLPRVGIRGVFLDLGRAEPVQPAPSAEGAHALQQKAPSRSAGATGTDASGRHLRYRKLSPGPSATMRFASMPGFLRSSTKRPVGWGSSAPGGPRGREPGERRLVVVAVAVRLG